MHPYRSFVAVLLLLLAPGLVQSSDQSGEIAELRALLEAVKVDYDNRITQLESRLSQAERMAQGARRSAEDATEMAEETAINAGARATAANTFNPSVGVVLVAGWSDVDAGWEEIPGFLPGGELGPGGSGFSLGESELNMKANIDTRVFGSLTLALENDAGETEIGIEEAWVQSSALPQGLSLTAGRFFSGLGYLNSFHRHADEFSDRPLPYQAFLGGQAITDGAQLRWIAPTDLFVEFGAEFNWGSGFPATGNGRTSPDAWTLFGKTGGDVGASHSWQAGMSRSSVKVIGRDAGSVATGEFSGDGDLGVIDFVWKWAPGGNPVAKNFKLQGEHFWRDEKGAFDGTLYDGDQSGWYLQGVWQFMPQWRVGYRHDEVSSDNGPLFVGTALEDPLNTPKRDSLMLDWSWSEYSRVRVQYIHDQVLPSADKQFVLQYLMSLGAHGAHQF